jgi:type VI secretion system protein ImpL
MKAHGRGSALTDVTTLMFLWLPLLLAWGLAWHRLALNHGTAFRIVSAVLLALYLVCVVWLLAKWLRLARLNRLPWYLVVGPPGVGKTTLLKGSGLPWEYAAPTAPRILDAFFTGRSIVLNDVGGYVLHSDEGSPPGIRRELQKHLIRFLRERQPRAVLVTLALDGEGDRGGPDADERRARSLRALVGEVVDGLGVDPPVFLVFTHCDRLPGFAQFAGHLSAAERDQAWGAGLTVDQQRQPGAAFEAECDAISRVLSARVLRSMTPGRTEANRAAFGFPSAFRRACHARADFVSTFFARSPDREPLLFRGFCFVSGAPDAPGSNGAAVAPAAPVAAAASAGARSYFVTGLLADTLGTDDVPPTPTGAAVRRRWVRRIVLSACSCAAGVALLLAFAPQFSRPLYP